LALKYGFIRVIFFPANVVKAEKHNRKLLCHLPHVIAPNLVNVAESAVHHVAHVLKAENANSEGNVLRVHRGSVLQEESDHRRVAKEPRAHRVRRESVLLARLVKGQLEPGGLKALPRKLQ